MWNIWKTPYVIASVWEMQKHTYIYGKKSQATVDTDTFWSFHIASDIGVVSVDISILWKYCYNFSLHGVVFGIMITFVEEMLHLSNFKQAWLRSVCNFFA